jgi:hypothetical protein
MYFRNDYAANDPQYGIGAKWLELLKQIVPSVTRAEQCFAIPP